jgi:hypothetical protein
MRKLVCCAILMTRSGVAQAVEWKENLSVGSAVLLGAGGSLAFNNGTARPMGASIGLAGRGRLVLHDYFAAGAALQALRWTAKDADGGSSVVELSLRPEGRYPLGDHLELDALVPIGLTLSILPESTWGVGDTALGWHIGLLAGARYAVSDRMRLTGEIGFVRRAAQHDLGLHIDARTVEPALDLGVEIVL